MSHTHTHLNSVYVGLSVCFTMAALELAGIFINMTMLCHLVQVKIHIQKSIKTLSSLKLHALQLQLICPLQSA